MKDYFITLDTGTTNTRAVLWHRDGTPVCMERCGIRQQTERIPGLCRMCGSVWSVFWKREDKRIEMWKECSLPE